MQPMRLWSALILAAALGTAMPGATGRTARAEQPGAGTVSGQVWLRDMRPRFITVPERLIIAQADWSHILSGDFHDTPTDDLLMLRRDLTHAELVLFDENAMIS